jgi:hypothetical protein
LDGQGMQHIWDEENFIQNLHGERDYLDDTGVDRRIILKWILKK